MKIKPAHTPFKRLIERYEQALHGVKAVSSKMESGELQDALDEITTNTYAAEDLELAKRSANSHAELLEALKQTLQKFIDAVGEYSAFEGDQEFIAKQKLLIANAEQVQS